MDNDPTKNHNSKTESSRPQSANTSEETGTTVSSEQPTSATAPAQNSSASATPASAAPIVAQDDVVMPGTDQNQPVVVVMKPPKKNKLGVIVAALVLILILIGGIGMAVWYFVIYNNPENIAFDAVRQFITADNIVTTGELTNRYVSIYDYDRNCSTVNAPGIQSDCLSDSKTTLMKLKFESASNHLPNMTKVSLELSERDDNNEIVDDHLVTLDLGTGVMADGVIYLQVSNLHETFEKVLEENYIDLTNDDDENVQQWAMVEEIIDIIDNEWWQISAEDVMDTMSEIMSDDKAETKPFVDAYNCIFKTAATNHSEEIAKLYDQNRFLSVEKADRDTGIAGRSFYKADIDLDKLVEFYDQSLSSQASNDVVACVNTFYKDMDYDEQITIDDLKEYSNTKELKESLQKELPDEWSAYLDIADFSHKLHGVVVDAKDPGMELSADLDFNYADAEVTAPEKYRPISDLVEEVFKIISKRYPLQEGPDSYDPDFSVDSSTFYLE